METNQNTGDQPIDLSDMQRLDARVVGEQVQGVGYRDFVRTTARHLGINGWVRNEDDGSVHVLAEATPAVLDEFEDHLRKGPKGARVGDVQPERMEAEGLPDPFDVKRS